MNTCKSVAWSGITALLVAGFFGGAFTLKAADNPDSEQVSKLLSEARTMAFQLKDDAQTMESFTGTNAKWETHRDAIDQIKEHMNALARQVDKLKAAQNSASPWQKTVIDRIDPFLAEMEGYTEAVIENLNKHPERLRTPEYKDYLEANADYAGDLAGMIADFVDYGRTKDRLQHLTDKLEVPAK
jgi:phage-related tail protein